MLRKADSIVTPYPLDRFRPWCLTTERCLHLFIVEGIDQMLQRVLGQRDGVRVLKDNQGTGCATDGIVEHRTGEIVARFNLNQVARVTFDNFQGAILRSGVDDRQFEIAERLGKQGGQSQPAGAKDTSLLGVRLSRLAN